MKAIELMVNDLVLYNKEPMQVRQLGIWGEDRDGKDYPAVCVGEPNGIGLIVGREEIEPIPLTKEILEKNFGQQRAKGGLFYHYIGSNGICDYIIEYYKDNFGFCRDHGGLLCRIKYVHELQHAMRLCRIEREIEV